MTTSPYEMTLSLNVLNHLGINLYSNISAVISEVVANSYDADAENVRISVDTSERSITISDDGCGMNTHDINARFLHVGYQRRSPKNNQAVTAKHGRQVMGRKGIGKLSLFSIARVVEVYSVRSGEKCAFRMRLDDIQQQITNHSAGRYYPEPLLNQFPDDLKSGTRIVLKDLKKGLNNVVAGLRKRLARRFSILGSEHSFSVFIDDHEVTPQDRDYFHKVQFIWIFDDESGASSIEGRCRSAEEVTVFPRVSLPEGTITGWIATAFSPRDLKDDDGEQINRVTLMVRGKLAHENILEEINESSIFESYLIGEVHADFLDSNDADDIATSSRQRIVEDDPRYQTLLNWLAKQVRKVGAEWSNLRNTQGTAIALENPHIKSWFTTLQGDVRRKAERLFGKINQLTVDNPEQRGFLFSHSVLAFESLRHRQNLDALDDLSAKDIQAIATVFGDIETLEGVLYHKIVKQRLAVINKLQGHLDDDALEKVLQEHLYTNLWLLDPSWERATNTAMEAKIGKAFESISNSLSEHERNSRLDIQYKRITGAHVIVELKRHSASTTTETLSAQVRKYRKALLTHLEQTGHRNERVECVCVLGKDPADWSDIDGRKESEDLLAARNTRIVKYEELLANAQAMYKEYLDQEETTSSLTKILESLADDANSDIY